MKLDCILTTLDDLMVFLIAPDGARLTVCPCEGSDPIVTVTWRAGQRAKTETVDVTERAAAIACAYAIDIRTLRQSEASPNLWEPA